MPALLSRSTWCYMICLLWIALYACKYTRLIPSNRDYLGVSAQGKVCYAVPWSLLNLLTIWPLHAVSAWHTVDLMLQYVMWTLHASTKLSRAPDCQEFEQAHISLWIRRIYVVCMYHVGLLFCFSFCARYFIIFPNECPGLFSLSIYTRRLRFIRKK